jgi:hypothetical protein
MLKTDTEHWPGRIVLMLAHVAGIIDLVALPVWVGTTHTFVFGWLASDYASGRAVALTPAIVMSGAAIELLLGSFLVAGFGIPGLGIVALVIGVVSFICYRFAFSWPSSGSVTGRLETIDGH